MAGERAQPPGGNDEGGKNALDRERRDPTAGVGRSDETGGIDETPSGGSASGQARSSPRTTTARNDPVADWTVGTDAQRGRAREQGLNTDARGGPGSAREAGRETTDPAPESGLVDTESTEPREHTRIGKASSQGLAGAQGSGGGAERGINEPPRRAPASPERSGNVDDSGIDPDSSP